MDPISQGVVGATLPQAFIKKHPAMKIGFYLAFLGGMAPDLDVVLRSSTDPLLFLEYHRQFTHSLIFIPIGGLICALFFHLFVKNKISFKLNYIYTTLGFATHGLLDSCTTYGTQLLWPFSNARIAWNNISIIDPLFTLPLLVLVVLTVIKKKPIYSKWALTYGLCYLLLGVLQRERAETLGWQVASERDHSPVRLEAKPSFANIILWKIVYETEDSFYVDAVNLKFKQKFYKGSSVLKLDVQRDFPWVPKGSTHEKDIQRFRWFSNDYLAKDPQDEDMIIDIRYSMVPNQIEGLFNIRLSPINTDAHVLFEPRRDRKESTIELFKNMLFN